MIARIPAAPYVDADDSLQAAADDYAAAHGLAGWNLSPRWADSQRDEILIDTPEHAA